MGKIAEKLWGTGIQAATESDQKLLCRLFDIKANPKSIYGKEK